MDAHSIIGSIEERLQKIKGIRVYYVHMSLAFNKRATFDYDLLEEFEGGLALTGAETKSVKAGHVRLSGAFLHVRNGELWIKNLLVTPYGPAGEKAVQTASRDRKVLVHRRELEKIAGKTQAEGLTLVPVSLYTRRNLVKIGFALARGKRKHEKREAIKKREVQRSLQERMRE